MEMVEIMKLWQAVSYLQGQMYVIMGLSLASFAGTCAIFIQNRRNGKKQ